jgi:hypothetical protein
MSDTFDTNVSNYTANELLMILDLHSQDHDEIVEKTNAYIDKFTDEGNTELADFFIDVQAALVGMAGATRGEKTELPGQSVAEQTRDWFKHEALQQHNPIQKQKITDRKSSTDVYNDPHLPMNREQLGINNTYSVPVAQDVLNPNLKNITSRFINIDSQYRQASAGVEFSATDFTLDLSEPLNNVLSLRLYSIQIPYAWYSIDTAYGNSCFWIVFNNNPSVTVQISISSGNYTPSQVVTKINMGDNGKGNFNLFSFPNGQAASATFPFSFASTTGKISFDLFGASCVIDGATYRVDASTQVVFFDPTARLQGPGKMSSQTNAINQTLGWVLGFRMPLVLVDPDGNVAPSLLDIYGPKYLILVIDDFNQNHINNGLITITEMSRDVKVPSYYNYSPSIPYVCAGGSTSVNLATDVQSLGDVYDSNHGTSSSQGLLFAEKLKMSFKQYPQVVPSAPRILTQAQIYAVNEIIKNNERNTSFRTKAPSSSDTFALIPIKHGGFNTGDVYVEFSGSLQDNKRIYFGPVNIDRMRVRLMDDKGNTVNMNGVDWSFTLISENLYQY